MGLLDGPMRKVAQTLIGKLGATCSLGRTVRGTYDPITDQDEEDLIQGWDNVEITPPSSFMIDEAHRADMLGSFGTTIEEGDLMVSISALHLEGRNIPAPEQGWSLTKDGITYRVKAVGRTYSGDQVAMYTLHCGK